VVDTNVWAVADMRHAAASEACVESCQRWLREFCATGVLVVDYPDLTVLREYRRNLDPSGLWYRLLSQMQQAQRLVGRAIQYDGDGLAVVPSHSGLDALHSDDRKFVALAVQEPKAPIANAVDTDWSAVADALTNLGVDVIQLCPADIEGFLARSRQS
jgi:hypothetical protein